MALYLTGNRYDGKATWPEEVARLTHSLMRTRIRLLIKPWTRSRQSTGMRMGRKATVKPVINTRRQRDELWFERVISLIHFQGNTLSLELLSRFLKKPRTIGRFLKALQ
jgi:hypothetical protein